jgi:GNAT superfamily N-acetyltransferase
MVCAEDREKLRRGFERLSNESRYTRFLTPKSQLSESELEYLTELDGYHHFAIGAELAGAERDGEGMGVARCVRLLDEPHTGEAAVTVVDEFQGEGLGSILLRRLVAAARERDIDNFRATLFVENIPMRRLLEDVGPVEVIERNGPVVTLDISLEDEEHVPVPTSPEAPEEPPEDTPMRRILSATARGAASLVDKFRWNRDEEKTE